MYLSLMRKVIEVICVSSLSRFSQTNDWGRSPPLIQENAKPEMQSAEHKTGAGENETKASLALNESPEEQMALNWLIEHLTSAFHAVFAVTPVTAPKQLSEFDHLHNRLASKSPEKNWLSLSTNQ